MMKASTVRRRPPAERIRWGVSYGVFFGLIYTAIAVAMWIMMPVGQDAPALELAAIIAIYVLGGVVAGAIVGLMLPLARSRLGAAGVGAVAMFPIAMAVIGMRAGPVWTWGSVEWWSIIISALVLGGGFGAQSPVRDAPVADPAGQPSRWPPGGTG